jgi:hypothetical protein
MNIDIQLSEFVPLMDEVFAFLAVLINILRDTVYIHFPQKEWYVYGGYVRDLIAYNYIKEFKDETLKEKLAKKINKTLKIDIDVAILEDLHSQNFSERLSGLLSSIKKTISYYILGKTGNHTRISVKSSVVYIDENNPNIAHKSLEFSFVISLSGNKKVRLNFGIDLTFTSCFGYLNRYHDFDVNNLKIKYGNLSDLSLKYKFNNFSLPSISNQINRFQTKASEQIIDFVAFGRYSNPEKSFLSKRRAMFLRLDKMTSYGWDITNKDKLDFHTRVIPSRLTGWCKDGKKFVETKKVFNHPTDRRNSHDIMKCVRYIDTPDGEIMPLEQSEHFLFRNEKTCDKYHIRYYCCDCGMHFQKKCTINISPSTGFRDISIECQS